MTQARAVLAPEGQPGHDHCVARCVRRAWLCGLDRPSGKSFEHRKPLVEKRILALGNIFAVGIYSYAVMSNHLHVVLSVLPDQWHSRTPTQTTDGRNRLCDLSWFMATLNEHLAKRFNAEDKCTSRFWEGQFKCQALLNEKALLAAMAYVDLNPIRAGIASNVATSKDTSVRRRYHAVDTDKSKAGLPIAPVAGYAAATFPNISAVETSRWLIGLGGNGIRASTAKSNWKSRLRCDDSA